MRKAEQVSMNVNQMTINKSNLSKEEKKLLKVIYEYPVAINKAAEQLDPAQVANYVYEVAKGYNQFYHDHVIIRAEDPEVSQFRLNLSRLAASVIAECLRLLGINAPERM
jgi:arginyl-tRNA synthetase